MSRCANFEFRGRADGAMGSQQQELQGPMQDPWEPESEKPSTLLRRRPVQPRPLRSYDESDIDALRLLVSARTAAAGQHPLPRSAPQPTV